MAANLPIKFAEVFNLTTLGIQEDSINFGSVSMESDKFITVREKVGDVNQVVIIDCAKPKETTRREMYASSAIMNPEAKVLALRAEGKLQIYNVDMKARMKEYTMSEEIEYWRWINVNTVAIVTNASVYHWSMEGNGDPVRLFARNAGLQGAQIINYRTDTAMNWCCVIGIAARDNRVVGVMQLYCVDRRQDQVLEGHTAAFHDYRAEPRGAANTLFSFAVRGADGAGKLSVLSVGGEPNAAPFTNKVMDVYFPADAAGDFPVTMQVSSKYDVIYLITRFGYIHIYHVDHDGCIYMNRISGDIVFATTNHGGGIMGINKKGQVLTVDINEATIVQYITQTLNRGDFAIKLASRYNLPGADDIFRNQFQAFFQQGNLAAAAKIAASSPNRFLRTPQTIAMFANSPVGPDGKPPVLAYFQVLLESGTLNKVESFELSKLVMSKGQVDLIARWIQEEKFECSEELGDLVYSSNAALALSIYYHANASLKVIQCLAASGEFDKIVTYAAQKEIKVDWVLVLSQILRTNPNGAKDLALKLVKSEPPLANVTEVVDCFTRFNMIQPVTAFLLDVLKPNREEDAALQTRLLEMNLVSFPQVADAILGYEMFTHYNHQRIAEMCEKAGLFQRALENYEEGKDIRRVMTSIPPQNVNLDWLVAFCAKVPVDTLLASLDDMLKNNLRGYIKAVVSVATKHSDRLTPQALIALFEKYKSDEGLFYYLGSIVNYSDIPDVHYKYIEASTKIGQVREVERICRESNVYDPERTKNFLKEAKLTDQLPLIIVCDRFDYVEELTHYLFTNDLFKFIDIYVRQVNPARAPSVIGVLLDLDCPEIQLMELITAVRNMCPPEELVASIEKRGRLKLLRPWLEQRANEGNTDPATFNALAKIYIDINNNAEQFLMKNTFYEPLVVGKYCEKRDPHLSVVCYRRGNNSDALIAVTNENQMYKEQGKYLVEKQDLDLWALVLNPGNSHRRALIDQLVTNSLPNAETPEELSVAVKAFMDADLPNELIELLEKVVLGNTKFSNFKNLQNLLILTAVRADKDRVKDYIKRLDNYDAVDIANICVGNDLFEEAFKIFSKFNHDVQAIKVLIEHVKDLERASQFASKVNAPEVWSKLANAQIDAGLIGAGVDSFIKADDAETYADVIAAAERVNAYADLARYLQMARKKLRETMIETELCYAYARTGAHAELEEFITGPNMAQIANVGERCFDERLFEAAKILFNNISNFARLATTLVMLGEYQNAVDSARKANSLRTWKEVAFACVDAKQFRLAQICGLFIIVNADELEGVISYYEERGHFEELIQLINAGLGLERAHPAMFTELSVLYSKYQPKELMEHIRLYWKRMNIPKVLRACEAAHLWNELVFLYVNYEEYDNAVLVMMQHSGEAFEHVKFKGTLVKVATVDICYRAVAFYLEEQPAQLVDLLAAVASRIDASRVVMQVRKAGRLALIKPFIVSVQAVNEAAVNEALNELLIEEEDYDGLRASIGAYDNFDAMELAHVCERHELLEFRRVASMIYKRNGRWKQSVELSRRDNLYKDAMQTAAESGLEELADELLRSFVESGNHECFAACLFTCYALIKPDVVIELAWRNRIMDFAMPYLVQFVKEYTDKVKYLHEITIDLRKTTDEIAESQAPVIQPDMMAVPMLTYGGISGMSPHMGGASPGGNYYISTL